VTGLARYKVPAVYPLRYFTVSGGLISYGPDRLDPYRRGAVYVDRILKGETPAELPVQEPTKYELVINLKTASALGITLPRTLLALADEVIEGQALAFAAAAQAAATDFSCISPRPDGGLLTIAQQRVRDAVGFDPLLLVGRPKYREKKN